MSNVYTKKDIRALAHCGYVAKKLPDGWRGTLIDLMDCSYLSLSDVVDVVEKALPGPALREYHVDCVKYVYGQHGFSVTDVEPITSFLRGYTVDDPITLGVDWDSEYDSRKILVWRWKHLYRMLSYDVIDRIADAQRTADEWLELFAVRHFGKEITDSCDKSNFVGSLRQMIQWGPISIELRDGWQSDVCKRFIVMRQLEDLSGRIRHLYKEIWRDVRDTACK